MFNGEAEATSNAPEEDIHRIYALAHDTSRNFSIAKDLEKQYMLDCCEEINFDRDIDGCDDENVIIDGSHYNINDATVDLNYLTR